MRVIDEHLCCCSMVYHGLWWSLLFHSDPAGAAGGLCPLLEWVLGGKDGDWQPQGLVCRLARQAVSCCMQLLTVFECELSSHFNVTKWNTLQNDNRQTKIGWFLNMLLMDSILLFYHPFTKKICRRCSHLIKTVKNCGQKELAFKIWNTVCWCFIWMF